MEQATVRYSSNYTVKAAVGGGLIVMHRGVEFSTATTLNEAAVKCSTDAIDGYPETAPDILYDVATAHGQMLRNVIHMSWYREALASAIQDEWPEINETA
jgi:hypothetical protein